MAPGRVRLLGPGDAVASAVAEAYARHGGPVLLAAADAPRLNAEHARMALDDLADGADATVGPGMDGGWYLAGLARPHEALLALLDADLAGRDVMGRMFAMAAEARLDVGLLRMERLLRSPRDVDAALADPMTPAGVRLSLSPRG